MLVAVEHVLSTPIDIDTFSTDVKTAYAHLCDLYRIGKDLVTHSLWHIKLGKKANDQCRCPIKDQGNIDWQIERQSDCITYDDCQKRHQDGCIFLAVQTRRMADLYHQQKHDPGNQSITISQMHIKNTGITCRIKICPVRL